MTNTRVRYGLTQRELHVMVSDGSHASRYSAPEAVSLSLYLLQLGMLYRNDPRVCEFD